jgi:2-oxoglutarate ferredoxin oxidoreductase subunit beta
VFVVMGDGDCCSIGAGHWLHATRYNMDMTVLMLDNNIYGLTKNQTSPTTPQGHPSNTQPKGSFLPALDPIAATLGITNASFVAQTAEWIPQHLYATLLAAYRHRGFSFVRILQRCPQYTPTLFQIAIRQPDAVEFMVHDDGVVVPELERIYHNQLHHDPRDLDTARHLAGEEGKLRLGVFFRDESRPRYDEMRRLPRHTAVERLELLDRELDRHAV